MVTKVATQATTDLVDRMGNMETTMGEVQHDLKEVRGEGMFLAMELNKPAADIVNNCMKRGFLINCIQLNVLRFIPPLIITRKEIDSLIPVLSDCLNKLSDQ